MRLCSRDRETFSPAESSAAEAGALRPNAFPAPYLDDKRWNYGVFTCATAARGAAGRLLPACPSRECQSGRFTSSPTRPPLPTNGRHRRHSGPKINREPCEQNEARHGAETPQDLRFHHLGALNMGSEDHPGVLQGFLQFARKN